MVAGRPKKNPVDCPGRHGGKVYGEKHPNARKGAGAKHKKIDWELVEKWVIAGASGLECAAALGIHYNTLYDGCQEDLGMFWSDFHDQKTNKGNRMIVNKQFERAMNGSEKMLIWVGKQRLGQSERINQNIETKGETTQKVILQLPDNGRRNPT